jgi:AAA domain
MAMRNPYTVGGVVRGPHFYGRSALIATLLNSNDRSVWVVGNRRIGKTSLLRQLEGLANAEGRVAFHINLEGADTLADLSESFLDDMDDSDRLARLGLAVGDLQGKSPPAIMRMLDRRARERGLEVLVLLDETEALIRIAQREGDDILKDLRREMQRSEMLRVVMVATKRLAALNDLCRDWDTSPFLFGVVPRYLGRLERDEALALIRQSQARTPQLVDDAVAEAVIATTDGHPYLTQWLCDRLWSPAGLRAPTNDDLVPDTSLIDMFQVDYNHLAPTERRILRCLAYVESLDDTGIQEQLGVTLANLQLRYLLQALEQLCYVRRAGADFATGNQLLHAWLQFWALDEPPPVSDRTTPQVSDHAAFEQADQERQQLVALLTAHKRRLRALEELRALKGIDAPADVRLEIEDINAKIAALNEELRRLETRG